jgi:hypothetical protein
MWDYCDPRESDERNRDVSWDRPRGSRGGRSDREDETPYEPRDVFVRAVDLPLDVERELVQERERTYEMNGTDSRVLATVGAFRVVAEGDLERAFDNPASARDSVKYLEGEGLLSRSRSGPDERVTFLSSRGRDLLEATRWERDDRSRRPDQAFCRRDATVPAPSGAALTDQLAPQTRRGHGPLQPVTNVLPCSDISGNSQRKQQYWRKQWLRWVFL